MGQVCVQYLIHADNITLITKSSEELQGNVTEWAGAVRSRGMKMIVDKRKVMVITRPINEYSLNISWEGKHLEQFKWFEYIGTIITSHGKADEEINHGVHGGGVKYIIRSPSTIVRTILLSVRKKSQRKPR